MITAILCAAGSGARAGFAENKVLREWCGMPVLSYSLSAFAPFCDEILIPCRAEDEAHVRALCAPFPQARPVRGGAFRAESVLFALREAKGDIVLVHDAARPFVKAETIARCIRDACEHGSGVCAVPATDTCVLAENGLMTAALTRGCVFQVQTPQGFFTKDLLSAFERAFAEGTAQTFTDESGIYAAYCAPPRLTQGDRGNRKLTYPEDFSPAERAGFGVDTHAFAPQGDHIVLAGVRIPSERALLAHSDGDVLAHAVTDALLSAAGLRDIGYHFPDTDERYRGADSMQLLKTALAMAEERGFAVRSLSAAVLAEAPRLSPYIQTMRASLAAALNVPLSQAAVAAGTNERLGYVGEKKGITCYALVLLKLNAAVIK